MNESGESDRETVDPKMGLQTGFLTLFYSLVGLLSKGYYTNTTWFEGK